MLSSSLEMGEMQREWKAADFTLFPQQVPAISARCRIYPSRVSLRPLSGRVEHLAFILANSTKSLLSVRIIGGSSCEKVNEGNKQNKTKIIRQVRKATDLFLCICSLIFGLKFFLPSGDCVS